jgi:hypothetical protein
VETVDETYEARLSPELSVPFRVDSRWSREKISAPLTTIDKLDFKQRGLEW